MKIQFLLKNTGMFEQLGIMTLSSVLKNNGHEVSLTVTEELTEDDILKNVKQDDNLLRLVKDAESTTALRTPYFKIPTNFVKESVADDLAKGEIFTKRLEQAASKGRYADIGPEGLPIRTVIGKGSKAFRI